MAKCIPLLVVVLVSTVALDFPYNPETARMLAKMCEGSHKPRPTAPPKVLECYLHKLNPHLQLIGTVDKKCGSSTCFAYVARDDQNTTYVVFRGSRGSTQIITQILKTLLPRKETIFGGRVHAYFYMVFKTLNPGVLELVDRAGPSGRIVVAGQSMAGAVAALFASELKFHNSLYNRDNIHVMTFGEPRLGDPEFSDRYDRLVPHTWRVVHHLDAVPHNPPCNKYAIWAPCTGRLHYVHHRNEVWYNVKKMTVKSDYIICTRKEDPHCSNSRTSEFIFMSPTQYYNEHHNYFDMQWNTNLTEIVDGCPKNVLEAP